jgi:hypothetical protein
MSRNPFKNIHSNRLYYSDTDSLILENELTDNIVGCHVSIFHVTIPARSKSFSVTSHHVSVIPIHFISFILPSPLSVNSVHSVTHLFLCLYHVPIMFHPIMFYISSASSFSDLWLFIILDIFYHSSG